MMKYFPWMLILVTGCSLASEPGQPGIQGPRGPDGGVGPEGATGETGPTGPTGPQGTVGPIGPQGDTGPQGPSGVSPLSYCDPNLLTDICYVGGSVGIGTTTPSDATPGPVLKVAASTPSGRPAVISQNDVGARSFFYTMPSGDALGGATVLENNMQQSLLLNPSGGNVGIGTTSPESPLEVNGVVTVSRSSPFGQQGTRIAPIAVVVTPTPVEVATTAWSILVIVDGDCGGEWFSDLVWYVWGKTPITMQSSNGTANPPSRTYQGQGYSLLMSVSSGSCNVEGGALGN